jgi:hypothetical protein
MGFVYNLEYIMHGQIRIVNQEYLLCLHNHWTSNPNPYIIKLNSTFRKLDFGYITTYRNGLTNLRATPKK